MYSVYALVDPRDMSIRYIGLTRDAQRRYAMHLLYPGKTDKDAWLRELKDASVYPSMTVLESMETKSEAEARENYWIQHYLSINAPLTNTSKTSKMDVIRRKAHPAQPIETLEDSSEMEDIIKQAGWTPIKRTRRNNRVFLYVSRRQGAKKIERYVGAISTVEVMSIEQFRTLLLAKITR